MWYLLRLISRKARFVVTCFAEFGMLTNSTSDFDSIHIYTFVFGDLSKSNAHRCFLELIPLHKQRLLFLLPLDFGISFLNIDTGLYDLDSYNVTTTIATSLSDLIVAGYIELKTKFCYYLFDSLNHLIDNFNIFIIDLIIWFQEASISNCNLLVLNMI